MCPLNDDGPHESLQSVLPQLLWVPPDEEEVARELTPHHAQRDYWIDCIPPR